MQRFFLKPENFSGSKIIITEPELVHQITRVLRMKQGENFIVLDNTGYEFLCQIKKIRDSEVSAEIKEKSLNKAEPQIFLTVYQSMPKKMELFEFVLQKCTEIGASGFFPLISSRTERREIQKIERLQKILKEASEQCGRGKIPELHQPVEFGAALLNASGEKIILHCGNNHPLISEKMADLKKKNKISVFIGPEGGFDEKEIQFAKQNGAKVFSLGKSILRTETAAVAAASLILL